MRSAIWLKLSPTWRMPEMRDSRTRTLISPWPIRNVALRSASRSRQMGRAHPSSRITASTRLSAAQADQVIHRSIAGSSGRRTSSHCTGSPGKRVR
ncbi:hypothetical protein G6F32_016452 [Rhizopus arrhizus]|nr:hypothetical protein G6F32_016452 [Rhizopus arrhizus]